MLAQAIAEEFAFVAASVLGGEPKLEPGAADDGPVWNIRFAVKGAAKGTVNLALPAGDAAAFTGKVLGFDDEPPEDAITDNLLESGKQAAGTLNVRQGPDGVHLTVVEPVMTMALATTQSVWTHVAIGDFTMRLAIAATVEPVRVELAATAPVVAAPKAPVAPGAGVPVNLDLILDIDLPLWVRFGETSMTIQSLSKIGPGATIDLDRSPDDPVDVLVNNTVIARGEVVIVQGNYGVRVTEVVSTTDRIRSMGGLS